MPVTRTLRCPDCSMTFPWLFLERDESDSPAHCPRCGNYMGEDPQQLPGGFSIGTAKSKSVDAVYRDIERKSEARAEAAGDPTLKVTNMRDNLREGDVAAMPAQPSKEYTTQVAAASEMAGGFNHWQAGAMGGANTEHVLQLARAGQKQGTGARALQAIQAVRGGAPGPATVGGMRAGFGGVQ